MALINGGALSIDRFNEDEEEEVEVGVVEDWTIDGAESRAGDGADGVSALLPYPCGKFNVLV